jgi:hypothetical protein
MPLKFRPYPGDSIGIDPGAKGAIAFSSNGKLINSYRFESHTKLVGFNDNLAQIDPHWLHDVLTIARLFSDRLVIESPSIHTYDGKISVNSIVKLHQTYSQIVTIAELVGFEDIIHADPQNWQGYHSIQKMSGQTVKDVIRHYLLSQGIDVSEGVGDAFMIANYRYEKPPVSKSALKTAAKGKRSGKNKVEFL